jgi:hypothetical protein
MAMNGERAALEAAWRFFLRDPHETSFAQVVAFARSRCLSVSRELVRAEFERRLWRRLGVKGPERAQPARQSERGRQSTPFEAANALYGRF